MLPMPVDKPASIVSNNAKPILPDTFINYFGPVKSAAAGKQIFDFTQSIY